MKEMNDMGTLVYDTPKPTTEASAADYFFTDLAILILEPFENLLTKYGIKLPDDQRTGDNDEAAIYGAAYYNLEDEIVTILTNRIGDRLGALLFFDEEL